jgi:dCTP diphosphatase
MNDETTTLADLRESVRAFSRDRAWEPFHTPKNLSMAIAAEAAELMEHFLWAPSEMSEEVLSSQRSAVRNELADVLIYVLEFANTAGIDLASAVADKIERNSRRFPVEETWGRRTRRPE